MEGISTHLISGSASLVPATGSFGLLGGARRLRALQVWALAGAHFGLRTALPQRVGALCLALGLAMGAMPSSGALDAARMQQAASALGSRAERAAADLRDLVARQRTASVVSKLDEANNFINRRVSFAPDMVVWGQIDHWASPLESLGKGQGDCEDYAIAKYFSLVASGVPTAKLRMVYVRARLQGQSLAHMVLAYYSQPGVEPLILDNLRSEVLPASQRTDLTPVFSFNTEGLWQGTSQVTAGDPLARLSLWRELVAKVKGEGFL
jgi:predicted transglutaminase-like cysteine proteinase